MGFGDAQQPSSHSFGVASDDRTNGHGGFGGTPRRPRAVDTAPDMDPQYGHGPTIYYEDGSNWAGAVAWVVIVLVAYCTAKGSAKIDDEVNAATAEIAVRLLAQKEAPQLDAMINGHPINLNTLSAEGRTLTRMLGPQKGEIVLTASNAKENIHCPFSLPVENFYDMLAGKQPSAEALKRVTAALDKLAKNCKLTPEQMKIFQTNLTNATAPMASAPGPFSTVVANGVVMEQRAVAPIVR